jgi:membrane protease YdiL (CAAX protease family)
VNPGPTTDESLREPPRSGLEPARSYRRIALRALLFWALTLVFLILFAAPMRLFRHALREAGSPVDSLHEVAVDSPILIPIALAEIAAVLLATRIFKRRDGLTWADVGLGRGRVLADLFLGTAIGTVEFALVPLLGLAPGWVALAPGGGAPDLSAGVVAAALLSFGVVLFALVPAAAFEEIADRGYVFTILAARHRVAAVLVTALAFTLMHAGNTGFNAVAFAHVFLAGVALAVGRIRSGALWLPIGWHFGWNVAQGWVFGAAVSGMHPAPSALLTLQLDGPPLMTGGEFGPESGLLAVGASLLTLLAYVKLVPARGAPAPPPPAPP